MRYVSVCSGIEAATVAWRPLGWEAVAFAEIDAFPSAVLAHHYPSVPNWGDLTAFRSWPDANVDVLVGGTPCQSFSVAGLRAGLADPRGNLALTYLAVAERYRPRWVVWENVPGVRSVDGGRGFGAKASGGHGFAVSGDTAPTLRSMSASPTGRDNGGGQLAVAGQWGVRRLTPLEWERLQGFPDGYTLVPVRGKPAADSPRYKAIGNSMPVPVVRHIGERIDAVEALVRELGLAA